MNNISPSPSNTSLPTESERRGELILRTLPIVLIPIVVSMITFWLLRTSADESLVRVSDGSPYRLLLRIVVLVIFFTALIMLVRFGQSTLSALALIGVWTLLTTLAALQNGVTSVFPALLILPICAAGLLIDGVASISLAALATLLVVSLGWLEMQGFIVADTFEPPFIIAYRPYISASYWAGLFWTIAGLTWLLAGSLQRAFKQSHAQAEALSDLSNQLEGRVAAQTAELLLQAQEAAALEERTRLAREIHDTLAQGLTGIVVQLGAAERALAVSPENTSKHIALAHRMARESLAEARRSVWNLRVPALERGNLSDALQGLVTRALPPETKTSFNEHGEPWLLPPHVESALLRVCQEALANVSKHANATQVTVQLTYSTDDVQLSISDNGVGFDNTLLEQPTIKPGPWGGFGLLGMRERLKALGGTLKLKNGQGAEVVAVVPKEQLL